MIVCIFAWTRSQIILRFRDPQHQFLYVFRSPFLCPALPHGSLMSSVRKSGISVPYAFSLVLSGSLVSLLSFACLSLPFLSLSLPLSIPYTIKICRHLPGASHEEQSVSFWVLMAAMREAHRNAIIP